MSINKFILTAAVATLWAGAASAQLSAEEVKQLGGKLTEFGAEKAGNADGSIPAYTGGIKTIPAGYKPGSGRYIDPFKDEKPVVVIDAKNMGQYSKFLTDASKALFDRFPATYKMNIYPTHRTMGYPDWVLKNTLKNASTAKEIGDGEGVEGAFGGIPFPIPKNGTQVMWNNNLRYQGVYNIVAFHSELVDRTGRKVMINEQETKLLFPYYDQKAGKLPDAFYHIGSTTVTGPATQAGTGFLLKYSSNFDAHDDAGWQYTPGQRRVRVAPELKYDTPVSTAAGAMLFDEINGFNGRMDRYDFKLVGKKELFIPYNSYRTFYSADLNGEKHENPDEMRFEKHRVWVVEAALKPGKRHIFAKRRFYIDEDSWTLVQAEGFDAGGKLARVFQGMHFVPYDKPRASPIMLMMYDMTKGSYLTMVMLTKENASLKVFDEMPPLSRFTPEQMGASGAR